MLLLLFTSSSIFATLITTSLIATSISATGESAAAVKFTVDTYPSPQALRTPGLDHWRCHIDRPGLVCDPDALLRQEERTVLQTMSDQFAEATGLAQSEEQHRLLPLCPTFLLTNGQFPCSSNSQGIRLGIALVRYQLAEPVEPLYNATKPSSNANALSEKEKRDHSFSTISYRSHYEDATTNYNGQLFDSAWARLKQLELKGKETNNVCAAHLAKEWGLVKDTTQGCEAAMLILASELPLQIHVYSHPAVPIFAEEKHAIVAIEMPTLSATGNLSAALHSIIDNMRELIVHRQHLLLGRQMGGGGQQQQQIPSPISAGNEETVGTSSTPASSSAHSSTTSPTTTAASAPTSVMAKAFTEKKEPMMAVAPSETHHINTTFRIDCTMEQKFALLACVLFSLVSLCLALYMVKKHNQMREELLLLKAGSVKMSALMSPAYQDEP